MSDYGGTNHRQASSFGSNPKGFLLIKKIGLEEFELDKLLNGTLCLSPEIASSLERFLGIPASFWLSLQSAYEEDLDKSDNKGMVRTFLNFVAPK